MANEKNLKKFTSDQNREEAAKNGRKGGKASGRVRGFKSALKDYVVNGKLNDKTRSSVARFLGKKESEITINDVAIANLIMSMNGKNSTRAIELYYKYTDEDASQISDYEKEKLDIEKQRLKIEMENHEIELKKAMKELEEEEKGDENTYKGIPALCVAPPYLAMLHDINDRLHSEYVLSGGRGSVKSSTVSECVIDIMMKNPNINALVLRKVADTLADSVYTQLEWAIDILGLNNEFKLTKSPLMITLKKTGQRIYFRGADKPTKIKSIKPKHGYIGILWFEELDQFNGEEEIRSITQSAIRGEGSGVSYIFKSFNPPKSRQNWVNKMLLTPKPDRYDLKVNYTDVPAKWLGKKFIDDAKFLKDINPKAYQHEYLGDATGDGGSVFDNIVIREITDEEIKEFDRILRGVDWGWYPDPFHYTACHYDPARLRLFIFEEYRCNKKSNRETADVLINDFKVGDGLITCDSAEHKSTSDYRAYGLSARDAEKGPGSVEYSMKWLASLKEIIIDPKRCPHTAEEFTSYEYERDKEDNVISSYPDKNNHSIDAVRYATNSIWKKRGQ